MPLAVQQTIVPTVNATSANKMAARRPEISDVTPMKGTNTAFANRYEVPVQKVSMALPFSSVAKVCHQSRLPGQQFVASRGAQTRQNREKDG